MSRVLPPHPHVDRLKNEAKALLKAHRAGDTAVCPTLRTLHRFRDATDKDILAADIPLQEAQFALAMDYGFKDWDDLSRKIESIRRASGQQPSVRPGAFLLENVPPGGNGVNRFIYGYSMSLSRCGTCCDYDTMMGDSGIAFILQADSVHTPYGKPVKQLDIGWWPLDPWGALLRLDFLGKVCGRELRSLPFSDSECEADAAKHYLDRFHAAIVEALHKDQPPIAVENDVRLVCGYDDGEPPLLGQVSCLPEEKISRLAKYPWRVVVPGKAVTPMDRTQADGEALRFAVALAKDQLGGLAPANKLGWQDAFALWSRLLRDPEGWGAHFYHANLLGHLRPHRAAAVRYLRSMAQRHPQRVASLLEEAAAIYVEETETLKTADVSKETLAAPAGREQLAELVERVALHDHQAVERIEAAQAAIG